MNMRESTLLLLNCSDQFDLILYYIGNRCDIFHGTWCPSSRDCTGLVQCIKDIQAEVEQDGNRPAFFEYLDEAPKLEFSDGELVITNLISSVSSQ
jgi:hypothetical protein